MSKFVKLKCNPNQSCNLNLNQSPILSSDLESDIIRNPILLLDFKSDLWFHSELLMALAYNESTSRAIKFVLFYTDDFCLNKICCLLSINMKFKKLLFLTLNEIISRLLTVCNVFSVSVSMILLFFILGIAAIFHT